jgi:hypothetical protein
MRRAGWGAGALQVALRVALVALMVAGAACTGGEEPTPPGQQGGDGEGLPAVELDGGDADGGAPADAGGPADAGAPRDGGTPDAGPPPPPVDAGPPAPGGTVWSRRFSVPEGLSEGVGVAVAPNGDVLVASEHRTTLPRFGPGPQPAEGDAALSRFTAAGSHKWSHAERLECPTPGACGPGARDAVAVAVDRGGRAALGARYTEEGPDAGNPRTTLLLVVRLADGTERWRGAIRSPDADGTLVGLGLDADGGLYASGTVRRGAWDFGDGKPVAATGTSVFVAAWSASGNLRWVRLFGAPGGSTEGGALAVERSGALTLVGLRSGQVDLGGGTPEGGATGLFVVRMGPSGAYRWSRSWPGVRLDVRDVDAGGEGVALVGRYQEGFTFAGRAVAAARGAPDGVVALLGADGEERWAQGFGGMGLDGAGGVALDGEGHVLLSGTVSGLTQLGGGALSQTEGEPHGVFAARLRPADGSAAWVRVLAGTREPLATDVAAAEDGSTYVTGGLWRNAPAGCRDCRAADAFLVKLAP